MPFFLQIEVTSDLPFDEFQKKVIEPLQQALEAEAVGHLVEDEPQEEETPKGVYELVFAVTDQERASELIQRVLESVDGAAETDAARAFDGK